MAKLTIPSFKYGLDTRRDSLVSQPGTLAALLNAHINDGGEVEKRMAFVDIFASTTTRFTNTFGMVATKNPSYPLTGAYGNNAIVVFCDYSASLTGSWAFYPTYNTYNVGVNFTISYSAFKCRHPKGAFGGADDITMTGIQWAATVNGYPLVCATFSDGQSFIYYGGSTTPSNPVDDSVMGLIIATLTASSNLASQLAGFVNGTNGPGLPGWTAAVVAGATNAVDIKSPVGVTGVKYTSLTTTDPSGTISAQHIADSSNGTPGTQCLGAIQITATGAAGGTWTASANAVQIGQYTVVALDTPATVAAGIAAAINATVPGSGPQCTATSDSGGWVYVYGPIGDTTLNGKTFSLVASDAGATATVTGAKTATASPSSVSGIVQTASATPQTVTSDSTTCTEVGLTGTITFAWTYVSGDSTIVATNPSSATTAFRATVAVNQVKTAVFNCVVSGTGGPLTSNNVTISLECASNL